VSDAIISNISASQVTYTPAGTGAVATTVQSKLRESVSVKDFGAVGDGRDDSAAFNAAFATGAKHVLIHRTSKYYKVKDVVVPVGVNLIGVGRQRVYTAYDPVAVEGSCAIVFDTTGTFCMAFAGGNTVENLNFHGVNRSCAGFGPGSGDELNFINVSMYRFSIGFGKDGAYTGNSRLWNCQANGNTTGVMNFIDSHFYGCEINANEGVGIKQMAGANDCTFVGTKNEWNNGSNWEFYQTAANNIIGGVTDRSGGSYGFDIRQSSLTINGTIVRRSGRADASTSAHFLLGSNSLVTLNGVVTKTGADDGGGGLVTPAYVFRGVDSSGGDLYANGCDLTGSVTAMTSGSAIPFVFSGCKGPVDTLRTLGVSSGQIANAGTLTATVSGVNVPPLGLYSSNVYRYKAAVNFRNVSTGEVFANDFLIRVERGGSGGATAGVYAIAYEPSTRINISGASLNISLTGVAADGSSFGVTATNASGAELQVVISVVPFL
jgi:hypothetical protein